MEQCFTWNRPAEIRTIGWLYKLLCAAVQHLRAWLFAGQDGTTQQEISRAVINQQAEEILDAYGNSILRYAYSYLHNMSDAEEVLQDTLVQFLKTAPVFESKQHEKAWLLRVAGNLSKNRLAYNSIRKTDELNDRRRKAGRICPSSGRPSSSCLRITARSFTYFIMRVIPQSRSPGCSGRRRQASALTCTGDGRS